MTRGFIYIDILEKLTLQERKTDQLFQELGWGGGGEGLGGWPRRGLREFLEVAELFFTVVVTPLCAFVTAQRTVEHRG